MNRSLFFYLGIFAALALSWTGIILVNQKSYGRMTPELDANDGASYPIPVSGLAEHGRQVYRDLGCAACHTQQVRRPGYGIDDKQGWGDRQSVAREYVNDPVVLLGSQRLGPDLRYIGARKEGQDGRDWHIRHLYDAQLVSPGSMMPSYRFLFETRKILGERSHRAIQQLLPTEAQPPSGYEIVATDRAEALVAFLLGLKDTHAYPESANLFVAKPANEAGAEGGHK